MFASNKELPWIIEAKKMFGLHETRDNAKLKAWLKSDSKTLGDPKALPWCGDFIETVIKVSLPKEVLQDALGENPYWARNWALLGKATTPVYGAIGVFSRGPDSGHVGILVGEDATDYYVLGGNQGDSVSIVRIVKTRLLAARWPLTHKETKVALPKLSPNKIPKSTNEF